MADLFASHGIAALAYDKRGSGDSTGSYGIVANYQLLADDLLAGVALLRDRADIDPARTGVWGGSEGGWVAPLAAARSPDVAFVVAVSAPGVSPIRDILFQNELALGHEGVPKSLITANTRAMTVLYRAVPLALAIAQHLDFDLGRGKLREILGLRPVQI